MTSTMTVLVPDDAGLAALADVAGVVAVRYQLGVEPGPSQLAAEAIVVTYDDVDGSVELLHRLPSLRLVQTLNAGFDQWVGRLPPGVSLSNARGAHGRACAEWVAAVLLSRARRLGEFAEAQTRQRWERRLSRSLDGQRVAVLGAGDLGSRIAEVLTPFGCRTTMVARSPRANVIDLDSFIDQRAAFDAVVLAIPLTDATHHLVDAPFLAGLGDGAVVVNVGRGPLVDHEALVEATAGGRLEAILDVTEPEPLPDGHPLWAAPHITITPHVAGAITDNWTRAWQVAAEQIAAFANGEIPTNVVVDGAVTRDRHGPISA